MKKIVKNYLYYAAYNLLNMLLPLVTAPYLARILGAEGVGTYAYYFAIVHYFTLVAKLGLNHYGTRQIAEVRDNPAELKRMFTNIYAVQLGAVGISCVVYAVYVTFWAKLMPLALAFGVWLFFVAFDTDWLLFGLEDFRSPTLRNFAIKGISTVSIFLFVKSSDDLLLYALVTALSYAIGYFLLWLKCRKYLAWRTLDKRNVVTHIKPSCVLLISALALNLYRSMDKVMLGAISGMVQTGLYEYAEKIVYCLTALIASLGSVMLPRMSHLAASDDQQTSNRYLILSMKFMMFMTCGMGFGLIAISNSAVPILFGDEFMGSIRLLNCLAITLVMIGWGNVIRSQYVIPHHLDRIYVITVCSGAAVNLAVNALLIPRYGAMGACIGTICAEIAVPLLQACIIGRAVPYGRLIRQAIPFVIFGGIMCVLVKGLERLMAAGLRTMLLQMLAGVVLYGGASAVYLWITTRGKREKSAAL